MSVLDDITAEHLRTDLPELSSGDTVKARMYFGKVADLGRNGQSRPELQRAMQYVATQ